MKSTRPGQWKTHLFLFLVIFSNLFGDVCLRLGLRHAGNLLLESPRAYLGAFLNAWVGLGMSLFLVWMLAQMALLSWADLSYVVPMTSIGYALAAVAGKLFLGEVISAIRWLGVALIVLGVVLVSPTARSSNTKVISEASGA